MSRTITITSTDDGCTIHFSDKQYTLTIMDPVDLYADTHCISWLVDGIPYNINWNNDTITINGELFEGADAELIAALQDVFPSSSPSGSSYSSLVMMLTQSGSSDIQSTVLQNDLGTLTYQSTVWNMRVTTNIDYDPSKVWVSGFYVADFSHGTPYIPIYNTDTTPGVLLGYWSIYMYESVGNKLKFDIVFFNPTLDGIVALNELIGAERFCVPEIRVYP